MISWCSKTPFVACAFLAMMFIAGCGKSTSDNDGDGYYNCGDLSFEVWGVSCGDCDDDDPTVNPGAAEVCDGVDNDCNGIEDDNPVDGTPYYPDADGDGFGAATSTSMCELASGYVENADDCNDTNADVNPDAEEVCNGIDDDCNGSTDVDSADAATFYADGDGDGFGDPAVSATFCEDPGSGFSGDNSDCDDDDADVYPGATEVCNGIDDDCDGTVPANETTDADGDGYVECEDCDDLNPQVYPGAFEECQGEVDMNCDGSLPGEDLDGDGFWSCQECDDSNGAVHPGADEYCNGIDDNCNGVVDEPTAVDAPAWYEDSDSDGFGDAGSTWYSCDQPTGYTDDDTDCDDDDANINPDADEVCGDATDNNCDGDIDEATAVDAGDWWRDSDGDGYGDADYNAVACDQPTGYADNDDDCDDADADVNPGATEVCNGIDDDCDGSIPSDEVDDDVDGYMACDDCDDADADVNPGADEYCDGVDNDCDGSTDESSAVDATDWYADADEDGYGDTDDSLTSCTEPSGYVDNDEDCDDTDDTVGVGVTMYLDDDGDGYGDPDAGLTGCPGSFTSDYVADDTDCDDDDEDINPSETETLEVFDRDCDGQPYPSGYLSVTTVDATLYIDPEDATFTDASGSGSVGSWSVSTSSSGATTADLSTFNYSWSITDFSVTANNLRVLTGSSSVTDECVEVTLLTTSGDDFVVGAVFWSNSSTLDVAAYVNSSLITSGGYIEFAENERAWYELGTFTGSGSDTLEICTGGSSGGQMTHLGVFEY